MVYFIASSCAPPGSRRFVKIGYTKNDPSGRLRALQAGSPHDLRLIGVCDGSAQDEKDLHGAFRVRRVRRRGEWFWFSPEEMKTLGDVRTVREASELARCWGLTRRAPRARPARPVRLPPVRTATRPLADGEPITTPSRVVEDLFKRLTVADLLVHGSIGRSWGPTSITVDESIRKIATVLPVAEFPVAG